MPIAYSNKPIVVASIRTDTSAHFRSDLETALLAAGWAKARTLTDGAVYECVTPDVHVLRARLLVQDKGTSGLAGHYMIFQGRTQDESGVGQEHTVVYGNGVVSAYQAIIGKCQIFLSVPGTAHSVYLGDQSSQFAFGVPSIPPSLEAGTPCAQDADAPPITDIWWANGDGNLPFKQCANFRTSPRCFGCFDYSVNGAVTSITPGSFTEDPSQGMLTLLYLTPTNNIDVSTYVAQPVIKYSTLAPLNIDALIGWQWQIRGQVWDAFQRTRAEPLDATQSYEDLDTNGATINLTCKVWMSSFYTSLLLMIVSPAPSSSGSWNVAY